MISIEEACDLLYRGKANVPQAAKMCGMDDYTRLFDILKVYVAQRPLTDDEWQKDVELSWPFA